jgi:hypothetical protein
LSSAKLPQRYGETTVSLARGNGHLQRYFNLIKVIGKVISKSDKAKPFVILVMLSRLVTIQRAKHFNLLNLPSVHTQHS